MEYTDEKCAACGQFTGKQKTHIVAQIIYVVIGILVLVGLYHICVARDAPGRVAELTEFSKVAEQINNEFTLSFDRDRYAGKINALRSTYLQIDQAKADPLLLCEAGRALKALEALQTDLVVSDKVPSKAAADAVLKSSAVASYSLSVFLYDRSNIEKYR